MGLLQMSLVDPGTFSHDSASDFHLAGGHEFASNLTCSDFHLKCSELTSGVPRGGLSVRNPPEIPKAHENHAKLNPIVKTVKNC